MNLGEIVKDGYRIISEGKNYTHFQDRHGNNYLYSPAKENKPEVILPFKVEYKYEEIRS